jgi:hypothetical protein
VGLCLLDPVDNTPMTPQGVGYPSSLPGLGQAGAQRALPALVVGAAMNGDVIPAVGNYRRFASACSGPLWELELAGAGHLQFLDKQVGGALLPALLRRGPSLLRAGWRLALGPADGRCAGAALASQLGARHAPPAVPLPHPTPRVALATGPAPPLPPPSRSRACSRSSPRRAPRRTPMCAASAAPR